jgi:hypothetical protein
MMSLTSHALNAIRHTWGSKPDPGHGPSACGLSLCCCSACQLISIRQAKSFPSDRRRRGGSPTLSSIGLEVGMPEKALRMPAWTVWKDSAPTERVSFRHIDLRFPPWPYFQIPGQAGGRNSMPNLAGRARCGAFFCILPDHPLSRGFFLFASVTVAPSGSGTWTCTIFRFFPFGI